MTKQTNALMLLMRNACSRRRLIAGTIVGLGSSATVRASFVEQEAATASPAAKTIVPAKAIHQEEEFPASPHKIYEALLDSKEFTAFSGGRAAEIDRNIGGVFSLFAGHIIGRNLELVPDRRIVQAWRAAGWPEGVYSIARFEIQRQGSGTRIVFDHTGFPSDLAEHLESGWQENYWKSLQRYVS